MIVSIKTNFQIDLITNNRWRKIGGKILKENDKNWYIKIVNLKAFEETQRIFTPFPHSKPLCILVVLITDTNNSMLKFLNERACLSIKIRSSCYQNLTLKFAVQLFKLNL